LQPFANAAACPQGEEWEASKQGQTQYGRSSTADVCRQVSRPATQLLRVRRRRVSVTPKLSPRPHLSVENLFSPTPAAVVGRRYWNSRHLDQIKPPSAASSPKKRTFSSCSCSYYCSCCYCCFGSSSSSSPPRRGNGGAPPPPPPPSLRRTTRKGPPTDSPSKKNSSSDELTI